MMSVKQQHNEIDLVHASMGGDQTAVAALLQSNWSWLKAFVQSILGNVNDTDDVLQNVCLRVMSRINTLQKPDSFRPWLAVVARREAISFRKKNSKTTIPLEDYIQNETAAAVEESPLESSLEKEKHQQVLDAAATLPEKYRQVLMLKYTKDMTYNQISEILEIPVTTVQIRLTRARKMIFNKLTGKPNDKIPRT